MDHYSRTVNPLIPNEFVRCITLLYQTLIKYKSNDMTARAQTLKQAVSAAGLPLNWTQQPPRPLLVVEAFSLRFNSLRHSESTSKWNASISLVCFQESFALVSLSATLHFQHIGVGGLSFCIHVKTRVLLCLYVKTTTINKEANPPGETATLRFMWGCTVYVWCALCMFVHGRKLQQPLVDCSKCTDFNYWSQCLQNKSQREQRLFLAKFSDELHL